MSTKKILFIVNPKSGKGFIKNHLLSIIDIFVKHDMEVTVYTTQCEQDAVRVVREELGRYDQVICSGGDGTLGEVIKGMMQYGETKPVGYIPAGSTNDFASSLELPRNMKEAARSIVLDQPFFCDVGSFNENYFVYIAAFGVFTDVSYQTTQEMKNLLGHMAYLLEGAKRIFNVKSYEIKMHWRPWKKKKKLGSEKGEAAALDLSLEKEENFMEAEGEYIYGMITNSESVGGFRNITGRSVKLDDGVFEVTLIHTPKNPMELQDIISCLLKKEMDSTYINTFKTNYLVMEAQEEIPWTLDGEYGGVHERVEIINHRTAVPIMVKKKP